MADVVITPASGLIDFQNTSGISSATIQLNGNGNLSINAAAGDIEIGDTASDIFIGDGVANVDIIFEEDGEIRGLTGKTITFGQSDSFIAFAGDVTGDVSFTNGLNVTGGNLGIGTDSPLAKLDVRDGSVYVPGGTFDASSLGSGNDSQTDAALVIDRDSAIYVQTGGYLRNLIEPAGTVINIGQQNTFYFTEINLKPGAAGGSVKLHDGGTGDNVKLQTTGYGVTITGGINVSGIVTAASGIDAIGIQSGGVDIATGAITALNFVGAGNTFALNGTVVDISIDGSTTRSVNRYVATTNQTLFPPSGTVSYSVGYIDVFLNGTKLDSTEFTATNGTTITLSTGATADDIVELIALNNVNITDVTVVNDTTPELGGGLDVNGNDITGTGNINLTGNANISGISTATSFSGELHTTSLLKEEVNITAGKLSDYTNIDTANGMVHFFTATETTTSTPNIRYDASNTLNSKMNIGETIAVSIITTCAAAGYSTAISIDGVNQTVKWNGGSLPSTGGSSGNDIYSFQTLKTADATYTVFGTLTNFAAG